MRRVATPSGYFAAAFELLADEGHGALKIGALCRAVGVTAGSFYHYFGSWDGFVTALLDDWRQNRTVAITAAVESEPDPVARVHTIKKLALDLPHEAERAIRAWAHTNLAVAAAQAQVDDERLAELRAVIGSVVGDRETADQLAVAGMTLLIGTQQWHHPVDRAALARLLDDFERVVLGAAG